MTGLDTDNTISLVADAKDVYTVDVGVLVNVIEEGGFNVEKDADLDVGDQVGWEITPTDDDE